MVSKIINDNLVKQAENTLSKLKSKGTTANKLKAIIASNKHGVKKVSEVFNVSRTAIYRWAKELKHGGLDAVTNKSKHQDGIKLKKQHKEKIREWLSDGSNLSIIAIRQKLKEHFNLTVSRSTVHRAMKSVGFSYITPRKNHYKQNKEEMEEFKKKSTKSN